MGFLWSWGALWTVSQAVGFSYLSLSTEADFVVHFS